MLHVLAFLLLLLALPAAAQPPQQTPSELVCAHVPAPLSPSGQGRPMPLEERVNDRSVYDAFMQFRTRLLYTPTVELQEVTVKARWSRPNFEVVVPPLRSLGHAPMAPGSVHYTVIMVPRDVMSLTGARVLETDGGARARVMPPEGVPEAGGRTRLNLSFEPPIAYVLRYWRIFVLPCVTGANATAAPIATEFAERDVLLTGRWFAAALGVAVVALIIMLLGRAAAAINSWQLDPHSVGGGQKAIRSRYSPIFICQDAFGHASLARFQVLLFTVVVLGVYAYAFAASHEPPQVSNTVLTLLGITLAGSTLAGATQRPGIETGNRLWLTGTGILRLPRRVPCWNDLVTGDGEVDITRVQALGFSLFAACALVFLGAENLGSFEIPEQLNYLIGISQAVYVAGRALPVESMRRLNEELGILRTAEREAIGQPEAEPKWQEFMRLKTGALVSLLDVFGTRLDRERLLALRPGDRVAEPTPQLAREGSGLA